MSPAVYAICAIVCAVLMVAIRPPKTPADEQAPAPGWRGLVHFLSMLGMFGFALAAIYPFRAALGLYGQIAVTLAFLVAFHAVGRLTHKPPRRPIDIAADVFVSLYVASYVFSLLRDGWGRPSPGWMSALPLLLIALFMIVRNGHSLVTHWRDDSMAENTLFHTASYRDLNTGITVRRQSAFYLGVGVVIAAATILMMVAP